MAALPENDRITGPFLAEVGQTDFPADFPLLDARGLRVRRERAGVSVILVEPDVTAETVMDHGFTARLAEGCEAGDRVWVFSDLPADRLRAHPSGGAVRTPTLEDDAMFAQAQLQEVRRELGQALVLLPGDEAPTPEELAALPGLRDEAVMARNEAVGAAATIGAKFSSREANVLDIADWDATGSNDNASSFQALINQAAAAGVAVAGNNFYAALGETIILPPGHVFRGASGAATSVWTGNTVTPSDRLGASTFIIGHDGIGFQSAGGRFNGGVQMSDIQTVRTNQPTPGSGAWSPADNGFDFYFPEDNDVRLSRVHLRNATKGLHINADRVLLDDISGQCFDVALFIERSYDTVRARGLHIWPFWSIQDKVRAYTEANLKTFRLQRVDNAMFYDPFSIWHNRMFNIEYWPGDGNPEHPAGTCSLLNVFGLSSDSGECGYHVAPEALGHTGTVHGGYIYGLHPTASDAPLIDWRGDLGRYEFLNVKTNYSGGSVVEISGKHCRIKGSVEGIGYNRNDIGAPGVSVTHETSRYDILPGGEMIDTLGHGSPQWGGDGVITGGVIKVTPLPIAPETGALGSGWSANISHTLEASGRVEFSALIQLADASTAGGYLAATLPYPALVTTSFVGREQTAPGRVLTGFVLAGESLLYIQDGESGTPIADDAQLLISGSYQGQILI